jgi:regulator of protease activity HflC (stomatin/prohibitin superfamily)
MTQLVVVLLAVVAATALLVASRLLRTVTVFEYERGLLYDRGRFQSLVEPGRYRLWTSARTISKVDVRPRVVAVPGQEVLTADGIAVKTSVVAQCQIVDPITAINGQSSWEGALHVELQLALRQVVSAESIDSLLLARPQLGERLTQLATAGVARLGVQLDRVDVRDLTLPGDLKKLFTQVTKARQEGLAALERARGETAALRNLANAARMVADNPALMQLRLLQVVGEQSGNTVVLGMPSSATAVPIGGARPRIEGSEPDVSES